MHRYTQEEREFLKEFIPGHTYKEISAAFSERFGWEMSVERVKSYMGNHRIKSGTTGRFKKGNIPANKGKKISPEHYKKIQSTMFKKGHIPNNHRPVGSERVNVEGYIEIKVKEPNVWKLKHRVVWEEAYGEIPETHVVTFRDGNGQNVAIDNLMLIDKNTRKVMNAMGISHYTDDAKDTAIMLAKLQIKTSEKKKELRKR